MPLTDWTLAVGDQIAATIILGEPVPKGRPRFNHKTGNVYTPKTTQDAEKRVRDCLWRVRPIRPVEFPLVVWLTFHCSSSKPPDGDNLGKLLVDAGQGVIYADDKQIVEWHIRVFAKSRLPRSEFVATCVP